MVSCLALFLLFLTLSIDGQFKIQKERESLQLKKRPGSIPLVVLKRLKTMIDYALVLVLVLVLVLGLVLGLGLGLVVYLCPCCCRLSLFLSWS